MRIALDATPLILSSGGLPRYVRELSLALAAEFPGDSYSLISDQPFRCPEGAPENLICRAGSGGRWWLRGVRQAIRDCGSEIFHGTNFEVPCLGRTPAVLTVHDLSPWKNPEWHDGAARVRRRTPWLIRLRRMKMILTVSEAVRREVISHFEVPAERVKAVPLAASSRFRPLPDAPASQRRFFLFAGTLEPRKNIGSLIKAWVATRAETGAGLVIVGRTRSDFDPIAPCEGLTLRGEVSDEELTGLYSQALAFVYPTLYEGFGLPVLEAMQCGCPVVTSRDPAVTEVSGGAALHTDGVAELAEAMRGVAANAGLRAELRSRGLARAAAFSWATTARQTRAIYSEIARPRA